MAFIHFTLSIVTIAVATLFIAWNFQEKYGEFLSGFSTKTAYRHCSLQSFHDEATERLKNTCQLVHINALFRHGTRSPSEKNVANFEDLYNRLVRSADVKLPPGFIGYPIPFKHEGAKQLLPMGYKELYELGQMFRHRARSAFSFTPSNIRFFTSSSDRAFNSGRSFYHGFFNFPPLLARNNRSTCTPSIDYSSVCAPSVTETAHIKIADHLLRFFDYCTRYRVDIEKNKSSVLEYILFRNGPEMRKLFEHVVMEHHLENTEFTVDDLFTLYVACAFETAAYPDCVSPSPWCGFLNVESLPILEYAVDLKKYWLRSYGYELNYLQSCPLIGEMLTEIHEVAKKYRSLRFAPHKPDPEIHRATFWFGHAETLLPVVAALGLFNDSVGCDRLEKHRAEDYSKWLAKLRAKPVPPTVFRAGHISPFAGNIALLLFYCPLSVSDSDSNDPFSGFYIQPEVNGRTVAWPIASPVQPPTVDSPGATSAPLSLVLNYFKACMPGIYDEDKVCQIDN